MLRIVLPLLIAFSLIVACGDETTTIYSSGVSKGSIYGRVIPADSRTSIELRKGGERFNARTDVDGYFDFLSLPAGSYELNIQSPTGFSRGIRDIIVEQGKGTSVGTIDISTNYAWPIYGLLPMDGANEVLVTDSIVLRADTLLDTISLKSEVQFSPALVGKWHLRTEDEFAYTFVPSLPLAGGTTYVVEVTDNLRTLDGQRWLHHFSSQFTTTILRLISASSYYGLDNVPPYRGYCCTSIALLTYNMAIDPLSLDSIYSVPEAAIAAQASSENQNQLNLRAEGELIPNQEYYVVLKGIRARGSQLAASTDTLHFKVSPLSILGFSVREPYNSGSQLDPFERFRGYLRFNAQINVDSLNKAVTIDPPIRGVWYDASDYGDPYYRFFPTDSSPLIADEVYTISINGAVPLFHNVALGANQRIQFTVNPVAVNGVSPAIGSNNVYNRPSIRVSFNAPMDRSLTEAAFSLRKGDTLSVAGNFTWSSSSTSESFYFDPSTNLAPGFYTLRVRTTATSTTGARLKEAYYSFFTVGY